MLPFLELPAVKSELVTLMNEGGAGYRASPVRTDNDRSESVNLEGQQ